MMGRQKSHSKNKIVERITVGDFHMTGSFDVQVRVKMLPGRTLDSTVSPQIRGGTLGGSKRGNLTYFHVFMFSCYVFECSNEM